MTISANMNRFIEQRNDLVVHHPLLTGLSLIPTPQIAELCTTVRRATLTRQLGLCFTAKSGMGKTSAMRFVATFLREAMPQLTVYNHSCRNHSGGSVRGFFKHFLSTVGHPVIRGETADLRDRLGKRIVDASRLSGLPVVVMLIDEAQAMNIGDFNFLKDVSNEVEAEGVALITILMAQDPDFSAVHHRLEEAQRLDLMSRFTLNRQQFRPFDSEEVIKQVFQKIDSALFSEAVPVTWTEFFLPKAFEHGFRLENCAAEIFSAWSRSLKLRGLPCEIPARQLFAAVRFYLLDAMAEDSASCSFNEDLWAASSHQAAFLEAAALASAGKPSDKFKRSRKSARSATEAK
jgi:hypothetical protein